MAGATVAAMQSNEATKRGRAHDVISALPTWRYGQNVPTLPFRSTGTDTKQHHTHRRNQNVQVEQKALVTKVVKVICQFGLRVVD